MTAVKLLTEQRTERRKMVSPSHSLYRFRNRVSCLLEIEQGCQPLRQELSPVLSRWLIGLTWVLVFMTGALIALTVVLIKRGH